MPIYLLTTSVENGGTPATERRLISAKNQAQAIGFVVEKSIVCKIASTDEYWIRNLDKAASTFLRVICAAYPATLSRAEVAIKADYSPESRHVDNTLAQLRSRDLIRGPRAAIRASEELF